MDRPESVLLRRGLQFLFGSMYGRIQSETLARTDVQPRESVDVMSLQKRLIYLGFSPTDTDTDTDFEGHFGRCWASFLLSSQHNNLKMQNKGQCHVFNSKGLPLEAPNCQQDILTCWNISII